MDDVVPMEIDIDIKKRKSIPKALKVNSWDIVYGRDQGSGTCYVCTKNMISQSDFECGHILSVANGGLTNQKNLIPLCKTCNRSMSKQNLEDYVKNFYPHNQIIWLLLQKIIN